jgi:dienelactone hydrolase
VQDLEIHGEGTFAFESEGIRRRGLVRGEAGAAVILMHELPGMTPECVALGELLAGRGFTVYLPLLLGEPNERSFVANIARLCVAREFRMLAEGTGRPITNWLRALGRCLNARHGGRGIGVIGMCLTGGFVLSMMADRDVLAGVTCQPALPIPLLRHLRRSIGVCERELAGVTANAARGARVLGLRFTGDSISPPERFDFLKARLGEHFTCIEIPSGRGGIRARAHSVLTDDFRNWKGHPTREAFEAVVRFLCEQLPGAPNSTRLTR